MTCAAAVQLLLLASLDLQAACRCARLSLHSGCLLKTNVHIPRRAGLLDHLPVLAYGERMSLQSLASVSVQDAQTLIVTPFDPQVCHDHK